MVLESGGDEVGTGPSWHCAGISSERTAAHRPSSREMLSNVFRDAKRVFEEDIRPAGRMGQSPLDGKTSMSDVQVELANTLKHYESRPESKARKWLVALSERIAFYGTIFDVLVQHHPEYVALAWGTFKFIFQVNPSIGPCKSLASKVRRAELSPFTGYSEPSGIGQETCQSSRPDSRSPSESESESCSLPDRHDAGHPYSTIRTYPAISTPCLALV